MTRKHFEALALALKNARPERSRRIPMAQWRADVRAIAGLILGQNRFRDPCFDERFYAACGYETEGVKS